MPGGDFCTLESWTLSKSDEKWRKICKTPIREETMSFFGKPSAIEQSKSFFTLDWNKVMTPYWLMNLEREML